MNKIKLLLFSTTLATGTLTAGADALPTGPLVKIGVETSGICEITPEQLAGMGFGSADQVTVYGYGGFAGENPYFDTDPAQFPEIPSYVTADGRLLFYGEGSSRLKLYPRSQAATNQYFYGEVASNSASFKGYYYVGPKAGASRVATESVPAVTGSYTTHCSVYSYHPELTNPAKAGSHFMGENIMDLPDQKIYFNIPIVDNVSGSSSWSLLRVRGAAKGSVGRLLMYINSIAQPKNINISSANLNDVERYFDVSTYIWSVYAIMSDGEDFSLYIAPDPKGTYTYAAVESLSLTYLRQNKLKKDEPLTMYFHNIKEGTTVYVYNADENTKVWDVSQHDAPVELAGNLNGGTMSAIVSRDRPESACIVAFDQTSHQLPVTIEGEYTPGRLSSIPVPDMIILTAPNYRDEAQRLADLHRRYQGLDVAIVEQNEIFDEFGSGARSPYAIRRFAKSLYDRDPVKFKYLTILGAATWDPAGRTSGHDGDNDYVLTYENEDIYNQGEAGTCYATDAFYGLLEDNDVNANEIMMGVQSINIGRIPAHTKAQAIAYVDKVERYFRTPPTLDVYSHAMVVSDYGDNNAHLGQALELYDSIRGRWADNVVVTPVMAAAYDHTKNGAARMADKVVGTINDGIGYMAYSGHANAKTIGSSTFLKRTHVNSLRNSNYPVVMLSTCFTLGYDRDENAIGEELLFVPNGGAIAVVGAGRSVNRDQNQKLNLALARQYFSAKESTMIGDLMRNARNKLLPAGSMSYTLGVNMACYNLAGDPALPVYAHSHSIEIEQTDRVEFKPLSENIVTGRILENDGKTVATGFNGRVILNLYAPEKEESTDHDPKGCTPITYSRNDRLIATAQGIVTDGILNARLVFPQLTDVSEGCRLMIHAMSDQTHERAVACIDGVSITDIGDDNLADGSKPVIESMYIDSPTFNDGDIVGSNITLYATVRPSTSGLSRIADIHRPRYIDVDGKRYTDLSGHISYDNDGVATIVYTVNGLEDGNHTATLRISDNACETAEESLSFGVITRADMALDVEERSAIDEATIVLKHGLSVEPTGRLIVEDCTGNAVLTLGEVTFPYTWDLKDNGGNRVADGRYTARAFLSAGKYHGAATPTTIVVVNE